MPAASVTINAVSAAVIHSALNTAILVTTERMKLKSAEPYRMAIALQIEAYKSERDALAHAFPTLNGAQS
jgi:hypothetical protein